MAFSFKLQTVFILPLWAVLWMAGRTRFRDLLCFPLAYAATCVPALLLGKPLGDILGVYVGQARDGAGALNYNCASIFSMVPYGTQIDEGFGARLGIFLAFALVAALLVLAFLFRDRLDDGALLLCGAVLTLGVPFFLPYMHDRYYFLADVLTLTWACIRPAGLPPAVLVQLASLSAYLTYLRMKYTLILTLGGQRCFIRYRLITGEAAAAGTLITTSPASRILQEERQLRKGLVRRGLTAKYTFRDITAVSPIMRSTVEIGKKFSRASSNVLITGETGTGKELFAHSIHASSDRMDQPFVAVNCATLPENLLESELFGYEPGAFSGAAREGRTGLFEQAHHGTIFLDEIGEIPVSLQAKLLRVLQEREVRRVGSTTVIPIDVRVIAATNVDIYQQVAQGRFRSDLLYRLNALEIHIPPLRERPEDILPLVENHLRALAAEMGTAQPVLTAEARRLLRQYPWPGNVRELRNICERLVVMSGGQPVGEAKLKGLRLPPAAVLPETQRGPAAEL